MSGAEAEAVRGVLGVDDGEVDPQVLAQLRQTGSHGIPAGPANHVTQKKYSHISPRTG